MIWDFLNILTLATIFTGVICLVDIILRAKHKTKPTKHPIIIDYARSFFPILLIVLIIRSFLFQPYRVPTGSLEPTIIPGDLILVNQFDYGLRIPLWNKTLVSIGAPKTGDITLFRWPVNPAVTFVKRVIGVPGDRISYINKVLYINDKPMVQTFIKDTEEVGEQVTSVKEYEENLNGVRHHIFIRPDQPAQDFKNLVVPRGSYFLMGDNRDNSEDCRFWGFVPADHLIGHAILIWMSWDSQHYRVRWNRIGKKFSQPVNH